MVHVDLPQRESDANLDEEAGTLMAADLPGEMRFLLRVVAAGFGAVAPAADAGLDWHRLVAWIRHHRLEPLLEPALNPAAGVPDPWREELRTLHRNARMRSMRMAAEAARLGAAFAGAGLEMLVVKGPALSAQLYGDPCRRFCRDLDLLVRPADEASARALLAQCGYGLGDGMTTPQRNALTLRHGEGAAPVELHVRLADDDRMFPIDALRPFQNAATVDLAGVRVRTLGIDAAVVYAAYHGAAHHWSRLYWLADFAAAARQAEVDWDRVAAIAGRTGSTRTLVLAHHLSAALLGEAARAPAPPVGRRVVPSAAVAYRMLAAPPGQDLAALRRVGVFRVLWADLLMQRDWRAVRALLALRLRPAESDRALVSLPPSLAFLYPLVRLYRVLSLVLGKGGR